MEESNATFGENKFQLSRYCSILHHQGYTEETKLVLMLETKE